MAAAGYDPEADLENPPSSVFCAHGAGFVVPWDQVEDYMHLEAVALPSEKGGADETGHCIFAEAGHYNRRNGIKKGAVIQFLFCIHRYLFA